jgi:hypothetical protein
MALYQARLFLRVTRTAALERGRGEYGYIDWTPTDAELAAIPADLRLRLIPYIAEAEKAFRRYSSSQSNEDEAADYLGPDDLLDIDTLEEEHRVDAVRRSLEQAATREREEAIDSWLKAPPEKWFEPFPWDDNDPELVDAVKPFLADPRIAKQLEVCKAAHMKGLEKKRLAAEGLNAYARAVPALSRAASENYNVKSAAVDHYVASIAKFDEDALVFRADQPEYMNAQLTERAAPNAHAFEVSDAVRKFVESLPTPAGVEVEIGRIMRHRRAYFDDKKKKWAHESPATVVPVYVRPHLIVERVVMFFADEDDREAWAKLHKPGHRDGEVPF